MSTPQTWLITGASRGIGFNIVQQLVHSPQNVVLATCRNPSSAVALNNLAASLETPGKLHVIQMDVTDEASVSRAVSEVKSILAGAGLDYLVNNAGVAFKDDTPSTIDMKNLMTTIAANVGGPTLVTRTFVPLIKKGERKVIINISSSLASIGINRGLDHSSYSISKTALNMLVYKQTKEHPDLTLLLVDPGWAKTDMGGDNAMLEPRESAAGIINIASSADHSWAGRFVNYKGERLPW